MTKRNFLARVIALENVAMSQTLLLELENHFRSEFRQANIVAKMTNDVVHTRLVA